MPSKSERQKLLFELSVVATLAEVDDDDEVEDEAMELYEIVNSNRYLSDPKRHTRYPYYFLEKFNNISDIEFRRMFRVTRYGFRKLRDIMSEHPIFSNNSHCKQSDVTWQLAVTLSRLGVNGNGASIEHHRDRFDLGTGSVESYSARVITALNDLYSEWVSWPSPRRRRELSELMHLEGFPGCVGFIDGTAIRLARKPSISGEAYLDRKKRCV